MEGIEDTKQLLLISNSTLHGSGTTPKKRFEILSEAGRTPCSFLMQSMTGGRTRRRLKNAYAKMGLSVTSIHDVSNLPRAVSEAEVIFVGGGNTFRLLKGLHDHDLLDPIRQRVAAGVPFIGSIAGSIVAYPTLKTTKDMPVVQPVIRSFGIGSVPDQSSLPGPRSCLHPHGGNAGRTHHAVPRRERSTCSRFAGRLDSAGAGRRGRAERAE